MTIDPPAVERFAQLAADPSVVRLEGLHCVKHALRFGADVLLLVSVDRGAALALADAVAPDVCSRLERDLVAVDPAAVPGIPGLAAFDVIGLARRPIATGSNAAAIAPGPAVLLEDPRNLGNLGAVVRVAAGFGACAVHTTGSVDPWHPTVVRAAAGLHFAVPVERITVEQATRPGGAVFLAFDPDGVDLRDTVVPDGAVLAFGSERHGLSGDLRRRADQLVAIPMRERVSSYNLATSVAAALYHWSYGTKRSSRGG